MDWKNVLSGAAGINLVPRHPMVKAQQLYREAIQRKEREGLPGDQALREVVRERSLGRNGATAIMALGIASIVPAVMAYGDNAAYPGLALFLLFWFGPKVVADRLGV